MASKQRTIKDSEWRRQIQTLLHSLHFLDMLVIVGFLFSIFTMVMTVYYSSHPNFIETNFIVAKILSFNHTVLIFIFGLFWAVILTVYWKLRKDWHGAYCSFYIFSLFLFNFVHDVMVVLLK